MMTPIFAFEKKLLKRIHPEDILFLEADGNYVRIHLAQKTMILARSTISAALKKLPREIFIRVHRSYVVSVFYFEKFSRDDLYIGENKIPVSKQYYKSAIRELGVIGRTE